MNDEFLEFSANVFIMYSELVASVLHFKKPLRNFQSHTEKRINKLEPERFLGFFRYSFVRFQCKK